MNGNKFIDEASLETTNFDYSLVQTKGFACLVCKMMIIVIITAPRYTTFLIKIRYWQNSIQLTQIQPLWLTWLTNILKQAISVSPQLWLKITMVVN